MTIKPPTTVTFQGIVPEANPPVNCTIQCVEIPSGRILKANIGNNCYIKHHFNESLQESVISISLDYDSLYRGYKMINVTTLNGDEGK